MARLQELMIPAAVAAGVGAVDGLLARGDANNAGRAVSQLKHFSFWGELAAVGGGLLVNQQSREPMRQQLAMGLIASSVALLGRRAAETLESGTRPATARRHGIVEYVRMNVDVSEIEMFGTNTPHNTSHIRVPVRSGVGEDHRAPVRELGTSRGSDTAAPTRHPPWRYAMPNETTRHREIFDQYARLGSRRSLKRLRERLAVDGKPPALSTLEAWSAGFGWQDRIVELERSEDAARGAAIRERIDRQQKEAVALQAKGISLLKQINAEGNDDPALLAVALRFVEVGVRLERNIQGDVPEPREPAEQPNGADPALKRFSAEELEELAVMLERKQEEAGAP